MKKFLSLVLALVMTMSLVTISAGAKEFADDDSITYDEAVNVVSEIGVVDGYTDGKFNPTNTLTRQAAAKIICNLILGPTTAAELHADTAPYKDVPVTSDFAGYIAYCAKEGIISGYADGTFRPAGTLTGYAFMKMLLGALGYDADIEGYTGANWSISVAKRAKDIGLDASLESTFNGIKAVNREEACLYAFNTLKADLVEYETSLGVNTAGNLTGLSTAKAMTWNNSATRKTNIKNDNYVQFAEQYFPKLEMDDTTDAFGRPSREWSWKGDEIGTYVNSDLLVETYTEKVTGKTLYNLLGKSTIEDYDFNIYIDGETEEEILNYSKGNSKYNDVYFTAGNLVKSNDEKVGGTGDGVLTEVYVDVDAKEVTIAIINTYLAVATKDYDSKKEEATFDIWGITASKKDQYVKWAASTKTETLPASIEDFDVEDIEEDDIVLVNVADGAIQIITEPEIIEDTDITAFKVGSNLTVDGTKYKFANACCYDGEALIAYTDENSDGTINLKDTTYNVILDPYGFVIGVEEVDPVDNFVFVTGFDGNTSNLSNKTADVGAIFLDGTMDVIEVDTKKSDSELFAVQNSLNEGNGSYASGYHPGILNTWCSYTVNDSGVYTLKLVKALSDGETYRQYAQNVKTGDSKVEINKKHISLKMSDGSDYVYGNDDTVYLNVSLDNIANSVGSGLVSIIDDVDAVTTGVKNTDIEVVTVNPSTVDEDDATNVAAYPKAEIYTLAKKNGYIVAAVVIGEDQGVSSNYAYVTSSKVNQEGYDKTTKDFTWSREVVIDGKLTDITYVDDAIDMIGTKGTNKMEQGEWYKVTYYADGTVRSTVKQNFSAKNDDELLANINEIDTAVKLDKTLVLHQTSMNGSLDYKNGSLYYVTSQITGFSVSPEVKVVLCNASGNDDKNAVTGDPFDEVDDTYEGYKGLEDAIDDLNKNFYGELNAIIEDGVATTIILNCTAKDPGYSGSSDEPADDSVKTLYAYGLKNQIVLNVGLASAALDETDVDVTVQVLNGGTWVEMDTYTVTVAQGATQGTKVTVTGLLAGQYKVICGDLPAKTVVVTDA